MSAGGDFGNPLRKFKLVFLGEQSGGGGARSSFPFCKRSSVRSSSCAYRNRSLKRRSTLPM